MSHLGDTLNDRSQGAFIGEILIRRGQLRKTQLEFALQLQNALQRWAKQAMRLGDILVKHRAISPLALNEALVFQEAASDSITDMLKQYADEEESETKKLPSDKQE